MDFHEELNKRFLLQEEYLGNEKPVNKEIPLVSVVVATYQHEKFIKQCLDGILMQITNFPLEIIVGEDESKDATRSICIEYANSHQDKIRLFLRDRKLSQYYDSHGKFICRFNGIWNRMSARGKYIAMCEGDDYWTDPLKLQKQVDFLENNCEFSLCCHRYSIYNIYNKTYGKDYCADLFHDGMAGIEFDLDLFFKNWITKTLTVVFRKSAFDYTWASNYKQFRDFHLFFHLLEKGKGYCFNFNGGVYTVHDGGIYSTYSKIEKLKISYLTFKELYEVNKLEFIRNHLVFVHATYVDALIQNLDRNIDVGEIIRNIILLKNEKASNLILAKRIIKLTGRYMLLLMSFFKTAPR